MDTWGLTQEYTGEPPYVKLYNEGMWRFCTLSSVAQRLMVLLVRQMTPAEFRMTLVMNATKKSILCQELDISPKTLVHTLRDLEQIGMIRFRARGLCEINPRMFGKGDWLFISKLRKTWPVCSEVEEP